MEIQEATTLALSLMVEHGLGEWKLTWSKSHRSFGRCIYRTKTIELSKPLVFRNPEVEVRDTILHEIAHALTPGAGHGPRWKAVCRRIGARPKRGYTEAEVVVPPKKWKLICLCCRKVLKLTNTRKPLDQYHVPCGVVRGVLRYTPNKKGWTMRKTIFVKSGANLAALLQAFPTAKVREVPAVPGEDCWALEVTIDPTQPPPFFSGVVLMFNREPQPAFDPPKR